LPTTDNGEIGVHPTYIGVLVFVCTFGGALLGIWLRSRLPEQHLANDTKDTVKVGIGLVATMTALVLGLVTASAKESFDGLDAAIKHAAAEVLTLDRALARYGPESAPVRQELQDALVLRVEAAWPKDAAVPSRFVAPEMMESGEKIVTMIRHLSPQNDDQRWLQSRALEKGESLLESRWSIFAGVGASVPLPFLVVLVFWLSITFTSFGLFAPKNATVITTFVVCAMSVAGAVFLILEMDGPFSGLLKVSPKPLLFALSQVGH
jgi:hypothetical protein